MQPIRTLTDILDDGVFISVERQRRLSEVVGADGPYGDSWGADLSAGVLTFTGPAGTLETPAHVIGTAAPGPGSWLWAWHNVNGFPDAVVARSAQVRELGARWGIGELTAEEVPLRGDPRQDATEYAVVAGLVNGGLPHYTAEVGAGTIVAFLVEDPRAVLPAPSTATAATVISEALMNGAVHDHRRALAAYTELRGLGLEQVGQDAVLSGPDGRITVAFDDLGRITGMKGTLGG